MSKKSLQYTLSVIFIFVTTVCYGSGDTVSPQSILENADRIRFPRESFQVDVAINTTSPGGPEDMPGDVEIESESDGAADSQ